MERATDEPRGDSPAYLNDLVRILALPARWSRREASQRLASLLDALLDMFQLEFTYARVRPAADERYFDLARLGIHYDSRIGRDEARRAIAGAVGTGQRGGSRDMPNPLGAGRVRVASYRLGIDDDLGLIVVASSRPDFPSKSEMLLMQVAVNQATIGLLESRRVNGDHPTGPGLEQRADERTGPLTLANAELLRAIAERQHGEVERLKLASLVENSSDFIGLAALDGRVLFVNRAGQALTGLQGDEHARSKRIFDFVMDDDRERLEEAVMAVTRDARWDGEMTFKHFETGAARPMLQHVFVIRGPDGDGPVALATIARDITQRKRSEAELLALKDELATELTAMTRLHEFGSLLLTNAEVPTMFAAALDAIIALQQADFGMAQLFNLRTGTFQVVAQVGLSREFLDRVGDSFDPASACGRAITERSRIIVEDVERDPQFEPLRHLARNVGFRAVQSTPLFSRDGEALGVITTHFRKPHKPSERDLRLTDLYAQQAAAMIASQRTAQALRRSEFYLSEGQKISHTGSWGLHLATLELFSSDENQRIFGSDPAREKLTFDDYFERIHPEDRALVRSRLAEARAQRCDFEADFRVVRPDRTVRHVHALGRPLLDAAGEVQEFVGMNMDVSESKHAEEDLRRAQAQLAHVHRAMVMGELSASIAHEINQPLAAVVTNAQACIRWLAAEPSNIEEATDAARRIARDALRASEVLERIRSLLTHGEPAKKPMLIDEVLLEVANLVQVETRASDIAVAVRLAGDLPPVLGDRVQLQQVVLNLVVNAVEAMRAAPGRRELEIGAAPGEEGDVVCVWVRDSGPGLDAADRERIFDAFYTTKAQGMGMGLAISRSIVQAHGGELWAAANLDGGETFRFTIPAAADGDE